MMNFRKIALTACLSGLALLSSLAFCDDKAQIAGMYTNLRKAMLSKSVSGVEKLEAPGFVDITSQGKRMLGKEAEAALQQSFNALKTIKSFDIKVVSVQIQGKNATVKTSFTLTGTVAGGKGKDVALRIKSGTTDTLVKSAGMWKFTSSRDMAQEVWLNGKKVNANGM